MFGVVLWSDQIRKRAVIWCEDHGDLAFFGGEGVDSLEGADMEPGDLVQFDIRADRHMRLASNPKLVASDEYPTLANDLMKAGETPAVSAMPPKAGQTGKIVAFEPKAHQGAAVRRQQRRVS